MHNFIEKLKTDQNSRALVMIVMLIAGFFTIYVLNNVATHFEPGTMLYQNKRVFQLYPPAGNDFRVGSYWPAKNLVETHFASIGPDGTYPSVYPPLVALINLPYTLFDATTAYAIHIVILILTNLACLLLAVLMTRYFLFDKLDLSDFAANVISVLLFFVMAVYIFSSYFFLFSLERGNTDIFAMFFCLLSMWVLIKRPNNVWLQVIFLSIAVHLKIYPIVLFALLLFKHGKKIFIPALLVNVALLLCLGPVTALAFLRSLTSGGEGAGIGNSWFSLGNHASYSYAAGFESSGETTLSSTFFVIWGIAFLVPLVLWGITVIGIVLKKYSTPSAILFFMVSIPIMHLLPTISVDYKLVILGADVILLLGLIIKLFLQKFSWFDLIQMVLLFGVLLILNRSFSFLDQTKPELFNKYVWVLLLEVFMSVNIFRSQKSCYQPKINSDINLH